jgi:hypothetical protein
LLGFDIHFTVNQDAPDIFGDIHPDVFTFAILDNTGNPIPTLGFNVVGSDVLLQIAIDSDNPTPQMFGSDPSVPPSGGGDPLTVPDPEVTNLSSDTPEPVSAVLAGRALACLFAIKRHHRNATPLS